MFRNLRKTISSLRSCTYFKKKISLENKKRKKTKDENRRSSKATARELRRNEMFIIYI
jgi:hypothetical protein